MQWKYLQENFTRRPELSIHSILLCMALIAIFSAAILMRILPAKYGFFLNEFDPYYNYRAVQFIVDNVMEKGFAGLSDYFSWTDTQTWYPEGRPVSTTSQVGLHLTGAMLYLLSATVLGSSISVYDFLVLFPVFAGALTTLIIFLFVRRISGSTGGLFAALIVAVSPPIISRGNLGWFKSEPLALLITISASYIYLTIYDSKTTGRSLIFRSLVAGLLLGYANTTWGGSQFFCIVFALLFIIAPFLYRDLSSIVRSGIIIVPAILLVSALAPRPGPSFISGPVGLLLLGGLGFTIVAYLIKRYTDPKIYVKNLIKVLIAAALLGIVVSGFGILTPASERYQTVVNPFQRTANPLVESVAEHFVPTGDVYFSAYAILIFLGCFGAIQAIRRRNIPYIFVVLFSLTALYVSASFSRLLVFSTIAFAILASIGLVELNAAIFKSATSSTSKRRLTYPKSREVKFIYALSMIALISIPLGYPVGGGWLAAADIPVTIASSSLNIRKQVPDWSEALEWIRYNTPEDSVLASWWDYGYWITVMGNRRSLADNATINQTRISQIGRMFLSNETEAVRILEELDADYVVVFVAGYKIRYQSDTILYRLGGGGDESKKQWFIRIGGLNESDFIYDDAFTPKPRFWDDTVLGKMIPFTLIQYADLTKGTFVGTDYKTGGIGTGIAALYTYSEKYSRTETGPFRLVFVSPSLTELQDTLPSEPFAAVLIYEFVR